MIQTALFLLLTRLCEAFGTACRRPSPQFTRIGPSLGLVLGCGLAFWFLSLTLSDLPLGVVYATWSGFGVLLAAGTGWFVFGQRVDLAALSFRGPIVAGIAVLHLLSSTARL